MINPLIPALAFSACFLLAAIPVCWILWKTFWGPWAEDLKRRGEDLKRRRIELDRRRAEFEKRKAEFERRKAERQKSLTPPF